MYILYTNCVRFSRQPTHINDVDNLLTYTLMRFKSIQYYNEVDLCDLIDVKVQMWYNINSIDEGQFILTISNNILSVSNINYIKV